MGYRINGTDGAMVTTSPTLELIRMGRAEQPGSDDGERIVSPAVQSARGEFERLRAENMALRRKLAHITASYIWVEGGTFAKIDQEIRQYGFRLERMDNAGDPRIVPI